MSAQNPDPKKGYETRDVDAKKVGQLIVGLIVLVLASFAIVALVDRFLNALHPKDVVELPPMAEQRILPPLPKLQTTPGADLKQMREEENQILNSYGWVDPANGIIRIPVDRAIDVLAEEQKS